jgi:hypothetical protein
LDGQREVGKVQLAATMKLRDTVRYDFSALNAALFALVSKRKLYQGRIGGRKWARFLSWRKINENCLVTFVFKYLLMYFMWNGELRVATRHTIE